MSQPIISAENLGKRYRIHHEQREGYSTLRDVIARKVKGLFLPKSEGKNLKSSDEDFWALKGVSFEVQPGEVVGIIGRKLAGSRHRIPPGTDRAGEYFPERRNPRNDARGDPQEIRRDRGVRRD